MKVESIEDKNIIEFVSLRQKTLDPTLMIAESPKVVLKAIETKQEFIKFFCTQDFVSQNQDILNKFQDIIYTSSKEVMQKIIGHKLHHGVMALIKKPARTTLEELDEKIIILNGLTSPENVGTIIRTAASFNIRSIIIDSKTCSPYLRRCIRVSMGNIFFTKVYETKDLEKTILNLIEKNYQVISAANTRDAKDINHFKFENKLGIIIGSEGHGIDQSILEVSSDIVKINIAEDVAHINAASAASIFLFCVNKSLF